MIRLSVSVNLPTNWQAFLYLLYRPLIGEQACTLYTLLYSLAQCNSKIQEEDLAACMMSTPGLIKQARERLEKYELLKSYANGQGELAYLELCPPLSADDFMKHPIYRRFIRHKVGAEGIERIKRLFEPKKTTLQNISQSLNPDEEEDFDFHQAAQEAINWHEPETYDFDWVIFFQNMDRTFPKRLRTRENMSHIAYLATLYGLDEINMRRFVVRHFDEERTHIDFDGVIDDLKHSALIKEGEVDNYAQSPVVFLKANQPEQAKVLPKEKALLIKLSEKWQFSHELINTIVEYAMAQCDGQFIESYILTLANNMARMNIQTRQEALNYFQTKKDSSSTSKAFLSSRMRMGPEKVTVPDWYDKASEELASEEEVEALLRLGKEILEEPKEKEETSPFEKNFPFQGSTPSFLNEESVSLWSAYQDLEGFDLSRPLENLESSLQKS